MSDESNYFGGVVRVDKLAFKRSGVYVYNIQISSRCLFPVIFSEVTWKEIGWIRVSLMAQITEQLYSKMLTNVPVLFQESSLMPDERIENLF